MARPKKISDNIVRKLEYAFSKGLNITEACNHAEITRDTYYRWIDEIEGFSDKMERAQTNLQRRAKITLADAIEGGNLEESKYYLERKCKDEFSAKQEIGISGSIKHENPFAGLTTDELKKMIGDG